MLLDLIKKGSVDKSVVLRIIDSTDGTPELGVVFNTSGIDLWYRREGGARVAVTEATLASLTTAHADGGFLHVSDGYYRLDLPDAAFATGATYVDVGGAVTGMVVIGGRVRLVDVDFDLASFGLSLAKTTNITGFNDISAANVQTELTTYGALKPTTAGRTLDVSAAGEAGLDWANIGGPTTSQTLSGTTIGTVTTLTNDPAGVTTLLSRIPAALFSGITSMAQWLGQIAGKQTPNATAQTEIRATGGGSGTYDATADSQEAIRDRGDAAWITGAGGDPWGTALPGAYGAGTAGNILGNNLNATVSSRATPAQVQTELGTYGALKPTVAARTLDVSATGEAGVDWGNVGSPTTTVGLSGTTVGTVTTLTNDPAGVTTLLARIPAALFSGITSLAQWLGLLGGKQTGNATARTELRATGAGSGTFDETTDSQEAIRDNQGTPQTGDSFGRIGNGGSALTQVPWNPVWDAEVESEVADALNVAVPGSPTANSINERIKTMDDADMPARLPAALVGGRMNSDVGNLQSAAVDQVWAKTLTALAGVPGVTAPVLDALNWCFTTSRNKTTQTATTQTLRNDGDSANIATATVSDDGTTFIRNKFA